LEDVMSASLERTSTWKAKRKRALERFCADWMKCDGTDDAEERVNTALGALTVAHIATALEWHGSALRRWEQEVKRATERLIAAWEAYDGSEASLEAEERLNVALDELAIAHIATTFEWASGPIKW
jgi:hypothetical protein